MWINTVCECADASGCAYRVSMCDGQHIALFATKGEKRINIGNLVVCQNLSGSMFYQDDGELWLKQADKKEPDISEQREKANVFLHKCYDVPICYSKNGDELNYGAMYDENGRIEITYLR